MTLKKAVVLSTLIMAAPVVFSAELESDAQKLGYSLGVFFSENIQQTFGKVDTKTFAEGLKDGFSGTKKYQLTAEEMDGVVSDAQLKHMKVVQKELEKQGTINLKAGQAFLAKNAKKTGIKVTKSGVQYQILKEGKGIKPTENSTVTVDYQGELIDGKVFDSSYKAGKPATFPLKNVIKGWQDGLEMVPEGSKVKLFIPATLAYGMQAPPVIGPNQVLIFTVELKKVDNSKADDKKAEKK